MSRPTCFFLNFLDYGTMRPCGFDAEAARFSSAVEFRFIPTSVCVILAELPHLYYVINYIISVACSADYDKLTCQCCHA